MSSIQFFVLHDYGQGGLWAIIAARSADDIRQRYRSLQVFEGEPPMLDATAIAAVRATGIQDIDDPPAGWLADLV